MKISEYCPFRTVASGQGECMMDKCVCFSDHDCVFVNYSHSLKKIAEEMETIRDYVGQMKAEIAEAISLLSDAVCASLSENLQELKGSVLFAHGKEEE